MEAKLVKGLETCRMWVLLVDEEGASLHGVGYCVTADEAALMVCASIGVELVPALPTQAQLELFSDCALSVFTSTQQRGNFMCYAGLVDEVAADVATFAISKGATQITIIPGAVISTGE